jgi:hypothetical protein
MSTPRTAKPHGNAQLIGVPAGAGEEIVRPVIAPGPRQAGTHEHPADVRFPDWARNPHASMLNVRNDGAVNSGQNTASSVISDAGTGSTASGSISGNPFRQGASGQPPAGIRFISGFDSTADVPATAP